MKLSYEQGRQIADDYLREKIRQSDFWSRYQFGNTYLHKENPLFWSFFAGSADLIEAGHAPGGLFAFVDKQTGRIWTMDEVEQYYAAALRQTQPDSVAA
jgi:hypothetical protein